MARPKLSDLEKAQRLKDRLQDKIAEMRVLLEQEPNGPLRQPSVGRPPVSFKVQLERLLKQEGDNNQHIEQLMKDQSVPAQDTVNDKEDVQHCVSRSFLPSFHRDQVGRPANLLVQKIEYKIRQFEQRIGRILDGTEASADKSPSNRTVKVGRKAQTKAQKIDRIKAKIDRLQQEIVDIELGMSAEDLEDLATRRLAYQASQLRKKIKYLKSGAIELPPSLAKSLANNLPQQDLATLEEELEALERELVIRRQLLFF